MAFKNFKKPDNKKQKPINFTWGKYHGLKDEVYKRAMAKKISNLELMRKIIAENIHRY